MASGKNTSEEHRQRYLQINPPNHRVLKRWEIENYLYDKEVLKKYCDKSNLIFDETSYDSFVKDINNQNLKDQTPRIKNFCGIITSINSEIFKKNLSEVISQDMLVFKELEDCIFHEK
jgi:hypothetical protein